MAYFNKNHTLVMTAKDKKARDERVLIKPLRLTYMRLTWNLSPKTVNNQLGFYYRLNAFSSSRTSIIDELDETIKSIEQRKARAQRQVLGTIRAVRTNKWNEYARLSGSVEEARLVLESIDSELRYWKAVRYGYQHGAK